MEQQLHIPGREPRLGVNLVEAAQEIQLILDEVAYRPLLQNELLINAMDMFGAATELCGGHKVFLHSYQAFVLNPREFGPHSLNTEEAILGEMWMQANFNGIVHFEEYMHQSLNSFCLDLSEVKVVKDIENTAQSEQINGTVVVPVNRIQTVMAA